MGWGELCIQVSNAPPGKEDKAIGLENLWLERIWSFTSNPLPHLLPGVLAQTDYLGVPAQQHLGLRVAE